MKEYVVYLLSLIICSACLHPVKDKETSPVILRAFNDSLVHTNLDSTGMLTTHYNTCEYSVVAEENIKAAIQSQETNVTKDSTLIDKAHPEEDSLFICEEPDWAEASFPGNITAWHRFLKRHLRYPKEAIEKNIEGTVIVAFKVCKDGNLCDIEVVSGPQELRQSAVAVIKKSPGWIPAHRYDELIDSYKRQPITYVLTDE